MPSATKYAIHPMCSISNPHGQPATTEPSPAAIPHNLPQAHAHKDSQSAEAPWIARASSVYRPLCRGCHASVGDLGHEQAQQLYASLVVALPHTKGAYHDSAMQRDSDHEHDTFKQRRR